LTPGIDIGTWFAAACPEIAVVMEKHDKTRRGKRLCEALDAVLTGPRKAMRHCDGWVWTCSTWQKQPSPELYSVLCRDFHIKF
jgi:hypothetical protein